MGWPLHHHEGHLPSCYQAPPLCMGEEHPPCHICLHHPPLIPDEIAECPQPPQPGPIMVDNQEEYEVEEILDSRFRWGKLWYLVKFIRWSHSDNMWLPHVEVHAPATVEEFHLQHPNAPHSSPAPMPTTSH